MAIRAFAAYFKVLQKGVGRGLEDRMATCALLLIKFYRKGWEGVRRQNGKMCLAAYFKVLQKGVGGGLEDSMATRVRSCLLSFTERGGRGLGDRMATRLSFTERGGRVVGDGMATRLSFTERGGRVVGDGMATRVRSCSCTCAAQLKSTMI